MHTHISSTEVLLKPSDIRAHTRVCKRVEITPVLYDLGASERASIVLVMAHVFLLCSGKSIIF